MPRRPLTLLPAAAAGCAAVAAWCSIGVQAVIDDPPGIARAGLLPPLWLLPVLLISFVSLAGMVRLSSRAALPLWCSLILLLPWVPGPVPAAFLIWTGHLAAAVWIGIVIAMAIPVIGGRGSWIGSDHRSPIPGPRNLITDPRIAPWMAAAIACVLYVATASHLAGIIPGGDEPHYLVITQSLLKDHDLRIENNHTRGDYLEYFRGRLRPDYLRRGVNGAIYSIHAPGLSVLVAPAFALGGYRGVAIFLSIIAAIGGALLWRAAYRLTGSVAAAWFAWATWALTVPFFFEAFAVYPDGPGATLVLFAALPLLDEKGTRPPLSWVATGTALALLPWLHTRFAIIAAVLALFLILRLSATAEGRSRLFPFLFVPVVSAIAWFAFFRVVYGSFNPAAPYGGATQSSPGNIGTGLPALLFDQQFGILPNAPIYGFCFIGIVALAVRRSRLAIELSATALAYLLSTSAFYMWWAGSAAPARFAVPVLPLLVVPGAWLWKFARDTATRVLAVVLLVGSLLTTAVMGSVDGGRLAYNFRDGYSLFAEWLSPLVDLPQALPTFFRQSPTEASIRAGCWILALVLAWLALKAIERKRSGEDVLPALALAAPLCAAVAVMLAATTVWRIDHVDAATRDTSELNLLEHFDPRIRPNGIDLTQLRFERADQIVERLSISTPARRPAPSRGSLLLVPGIVPAGRYALELRDPGAARGTAKLIIGRNARPVMMWNLQSDFHDGAALFDLPVDVGSLVLDGDAEAIRTSRTLSLRPVDVIPPGDRLTRNYARRVEKYGPGLVYFLDDGAFVEEPGFWVRGGAGTQIVAMALPPNQPPQIFVRNAPVKNTIEIDIDGATQTFDLQPREERMVPIAIPAERRAALIKIQSRSGFRPAFVEAGSTDTRFLGAWIELR